jgi:hypothetical protein
MEIYATRDQIRDRLIKMVGWATPGSAASHYDELIRAASVAVADDCRWASAEREARLTVGVDQRYVPYPANCGAAGVREVGLWLADAQYYKPLRRREIKVERDSDPTNDVGGSADEITRGEPAWYECRSSGIELLPNPDIVYEVKAVYSLTVELTDGAQTAAVDAELILLHAAAEAYQQIEDTANAERCLQRYEKRLEKLKGLMNTARMVSIAPEADEDESDGFIGYYATPVT